MENKIRKGNTSMHKSSKAEYEKRVNVVLEMLLAGLTRYQIIQNVQNNEDLKWSVADSMIDRYIADGNKLALELSSKKAIDIFNKVMARQEYLYRKMVHAKDFRGASTVLDRMADIAGLKVTQHHITGSEETIPMTWKIIGVKK